MSENGNIGVQLLLGLIELFILLFADDLALLSSSPTGLQTQLIPYRECVSTLISLLTQTKAKWYLGKEGSWEKVRDGLLVVTFSR